MNIAVIGIGGVGGYFGGKLTQIPEFGATMSIYFVARNKHLEAIQANGLLLDADEGKFVCKPTKATSDIAHMPPLDYCLICVKGYDLENVLLQLKNKIGPKTVMLPLLNGVDIYERVRKVIKTGYLHPACVYVGTHIEKPGVVKQSGAVHKIILGKDPQSKNVDMSILGILGAANIDYDWQLDPSREIWNKYFFIASVGLVTTNFNLSIGEVLQSEKHRAFVVGIIKEIVAIAEKKGIELPSTIVEDTLAKAAKFPFETKTSFQRDFEQKDRPDERDLFGGTIVRMGKELGIPTPVSTEIHESIMNKKPLIGF
ncbi:MAG: 2-dehydropantoate 2-reductase [Spirochaetales bacterium]|jgi:2-dehydropantoate 2-reductase